MYKFVASDAMTQEADLSYTMKKLFGVDLTPNPHFNSGAPHGFVVGEEKSKCRNKVVRLKLGPTRCSDPELPPNEAGLTEVLGNTVAWHMPKMILRGFALDDWTDIGGPFRAMQECVEKGERIWNGKAFRDGYTCAPPHTPLAQNL